MEQQVIQQIQKEEDHLVAHCFECTPDCDTLVCFRERLCKFLIFFRDESGMLFLLFIPTQTQDIFPASQTPYTHIVMSDVDI